jgi:hypothetical protein
VDRWSGTDGKLEILTLERFQKTIGSLSKSVLRWILLENPRRERPAPDFAAPFVPAAETWARTAVLSSIRTKCAVLLPPLSGRA